ncbi:hypothetical protein C5167_012040 [Papaver somniferum]|uniref:Uncharacterized protein n=1 Tax=Papaver somniferum TaxID=3469 RepID=A0A4Y7J0A4_PAPSO|nr:hypothetical protein C5167_012040 [Papaver somniferum]
MSLSSLILVEYDLRSKEDMILHPQTCFLSFPPTRPDLIIIIVIVVDKTVVYELSFGRTTTAAMTTSREGGTGRNWFHPALSGIRLL